MRIYEIPRKLIQLGRMCLENTTAKVEVENEYSELFEKNTGLREGEAPSLLLFNFVMQEAFRIVSSSQEGVEIGEKINVIAFPNDVALAAENRKDIKDLTEKLIIEAKKLKLQVNEEIKIMKISRSLGCSSRLRNSKL